MPNNPASIQQVRYEDTIPAPSMFSNIANMMAAGLNARQARTAADQEAMAKLLPAFAQQQQLQAGTAEQPGNIKYPGAPYGFTITAPRFNYADYNAMLAAQAKELELQGNKPVQTGSYIKDAMTDAPYTIQDFDKKSEDEQATLVAARARVAQKAYELFNAQKKPNVKTAPLPSPEERAKYILKKKMMSVSPENIQKVIDKFGNTPQFNDPAQFTE
jgi:hypothetical protein